jgi:hypothetical protein
MMMAFLCCEGWMRVRLQVDSSYELSFLGFEAFCWSLAHEFFWWRERCGSKNYQKGKMWGRKSHHVSCCSSVGQSERLLTARS